MTDPLARFPLQRGRYCARLAASPGDLAAAQALRWQAFRPRAGPGRDADRFDPACLHVLVEQLPAARLACCYRLLPLAGGAELGRSYAAQHYGLEPLADFAAPILEMGRFCLAPGVHEPDVLRLAWGALAAIVDATGAELLIGCTSFPGTDAEAHGDSFALLGARHLAPRRWQPLVKAPQVLRFGQLVRRRPDPRRALKAMPPLLRSYLGMGGWVSDHAVVDRDLGTLHVFTGLEVCAIPAARARSLRALAGQAPAA